MKMPLIIFPRFQNDIFRWLLLSNQQSKTQTLFTDFQKCQGKAASPNIQEAGARKCFDIFTWKMKLNWHLIFIRLTYQLINRSLQL